MVFRTIGGGGGDGEFGSTPVSIAGEDVANVMLVTSKGGTATGRVTFDGPKPPSLRRDARHVDRGGQRRRRARRLLGSVKEDGTFELKGLTGARVDPAGHAAAGLDAEIRQVERQRHHRYGHRVQARRRRHRPRDRADAEGVLGDRHRHRRRRLAAEGLHGRRVRGEPRAVADADDALGHGYASRSGRPLQAAEPAGGHLLRDRGRLPADRANGAIPICSTGCGRKPSASRWPTARRTRSISA